MEQRSKHFPQHSGMCGNASSEDVPHWRRDHSTHKCGIFPVIHPAARAVLFRQHQAVEGARYGLLLQSGRIGRVSIILRSPGNFITPSPPATWLSRANSAWGVVVNKSGMRYHRTLLPRALLQKQRWLGFHNFAYVQGLCSHCYLQFTECLSMQGVILLGRVELP